MSSENTEQRGRTVAIVGRPNVGKSAIFNRLARKRVAIVHAESGVTRDRLMREVEWEEERFELIDTGGVGNVDRSSERDVIVDGTRQQVDIALLDASVAIFVTDIESGITALDLEVAGILRGSGCTTFLAANKADTPARDNDAAEFEELGFPVFPVSALHNRGFGELMDKAVAELPHVENVTETDPLRVAVVGRPNVGKSSYINRLLRNNRVIVSDIPGTTRDSIDVPFVIGRGETARHYVLSDTAGMRRLGKVSSSVERFSLFRAEQSVQNADVVVLVVDATQGPTQQDKKIASMVVKHGRGCVVLVNKWDLSETTQRQYGPELSHKMPFMGYCPVVFTSAQSGYNIRRSIDAIDHVAAQVKMQLPTGILNRALLDAYEQVNPPAVKGRRLKIFYSTQVGVNPLRVKLFVNDPKRVTVPYRKYLAKALRRNFGLEGAPLILQFTPRRGDDGKGRRKPRS
jgi:GTP-binding protein